MLDANVSGRDFEQGKPHPMIFLTAAEELGVSPEESFVIEDAANGVRGREERGDGGPWPGAGRRRTSA